MLFSQPILTLSERCLRRLSLRTLPAVSGGALLLFHSSTPDHLGIFLESYLTRFPQAQVIVLTWMNAKQVVAGCPEIRNIRRKHQVSFLRIGSEPHRGSLAVLLHSDFSSAPKPQRKAVRRAFASAHASRRMIVNGDGTIWRASTSERFLRKLFQPLYRHFHAAEEKHIRAEIEKKLIWQPRWNEPHPADEVSPSVAEMNVLTRHPVRIVQDPVTGTLLRPDPLTPSEEQRLYESNYHGRELIDSRQNWPAMLEVYQSRRLRNMASVLPQARRTAWAPNPKALDIGCGTGGFVDALAQNGFRALGIERSHESIRAARQSFPNSRFAVAELDELINRGYKAELIALSHVLEHIADDVRFLKTVAKLALPTSVLYIEVPLFTPEALKARPLWFRQLDHYREYTRMGLQATLTLAGWNVVAHRDSLQTEGNEPYQFLCATPPLG